MSSILIPSSSALNEALPLVSVVTPSYQTGKFIQATIESVRTQAYPSVQHIIMDGGSTDETTGILESYSHLEWVSEKDGGQSDALNKGFRRADGEIIGWLNSDDTYEPGTIETAVQYLEDYPDVDAVFGDVNIIDENGERIGASYGSDFDVVALLSNNMVKQPGIFMRKSFVDELGGVDQSLHYVMDQELWLRAGLRGYTIAYCGKTLANFRMCSGTKSTGNIAGFRKEWRRVLQNIGAGSSMAVTLPVDVIATAISTNEAALYIEEMRRSADRRDRASIFSNMARAVKCKRGLLWSRGLWWTLASGLIGRRPNRMQQYEHNLRAR